MKISIYKICLTYIKAYEEHLSNKIAKFSLNLFLRLQAKDTKSLTRKDASVEKSHSRVRFDVDSKNHNSEHSYNNDVFQEIRKNIIDNKINKSRTKIDKILRIKKAPPDINATTNHSYKKQSRSMIN